MIKENKFNFLNFQITGIWYVIRQFETNTDCFTYNITKIDDDNLKIVKKRQIKILRYAGISNVHLLTGSINISNSSDYRIKWDGTSSKWCKIWVTKISSLFC